MQQARPVTHLPFPEFANRVRRAAATAPSDDQLAAAPSRAARRKLAARADPRKALAVALSLEPALVQHALLSANAPPSLVDLAANEGTLRLVFDALEDVEREIVAKFASGEAVKGYIVKTTVPVEGSEKTIERYDEFAPFLFAQYRDRAYVEYSSFDEAADEFFSRLESERAEAAQAKREAAAYKRVDKLASELKGQVSVLESARDLSWERAQAIEGNIVEVEAALTVINSAIAAAVPWDGLARMVKEEKKNGNPVAEIIHSLQLERNGITLMLEDTFGVDDESEQLEDDGDEDDEDDDDVEDDDEGDEGDSAGASTDVHKRQSTRRGRPRFEASAQTRKALLVSVDLSLGAHANARRHYEMRKSAAAKMEKAVEVTDRTLKSASKRAAAEAHKIEAEAVAASIRARRKSLWFEKFYWFVSSENYLVVAGRDAQQNELLVNRYLGPSDVYVHAELQGACSVIVKSQKRPGSSISAEIPRMTLEQAGTFAMCRSAAWESKIVTSAWWVRATQVSKTTPSGAYLPPGSVMIRGKKNFLDPTQLVMGLAFLFKVDESSVAAHKGERGVRGLEEPVVASEQDSAQQAATHQQVPKNPAVQLEGASDNTVVAASSLADLSLEKMPQVPGQSHDLQETLGQAGSCDMTKEEMNEPEASNTNVSGSQKKISDDPIDNQESSKQKVPRAKKKHLSAKERRALKNAKAGKTPTDNVEVGNEQEAEDVSVADTRPKDKKGTKANTPLPRGKKHKLKKMKKYSDQDEEERRIALAVLGSKPLKEESEGLVEEERDENGEEGREDEQEENKGVRKDERAKRREYGSERREVMRLLDEDGLVELENLERDTITTLDMLTAIPGLEDSVEYGLPVCAPYGALTNYRYKVKLMPGTTKRGKAYRSAMVLFLKQAEKDLGKFKQERDSLRLSPESDGIHGMLGNVKIMAPGLAEAAKSLQKAKKGSSKKGGKK